MQDPAGDNDPTTSDGIFVFTGSTTPSVAPGDAVRVAGTVKEFIAATAPDDLPETEIVSPTIATLSSGNALPAATVIGQGGLTPPTALVTDGIAFDEALEGMLVQFNDIQTVSRVDSFGEVWIVPDNGAGAGVLDAARRDPPAGGRRQPGEVPARRRLLAATMPTADVGATSPGPHVGVMDYAFDNYTVHLLKRAALAAEPDPEGSHDRRRRSRSPHGCDFNMENLAPGDPVSKYDGLANVFVNNLRAPDIVALEEVQDNERGDRRRCRRLDGDARQAERGDRARRRPELRVRLGEPRRRPGRRPAGRQHPRRVRLPHRRGRPFARARHGGWLARRNAVVGTGPDALKYNPGRVDPTSSAWRTAASRSRENSSSTGTRFS